jgi:CRP/FNR family transcriptional regulator
MRPDRAATESAQSGLDVLAGLTANDRRLLQSLATRAAVPPGRMVFTQGDPGQHFYLVESGEVRIFYHSPTGREPTIAYCRRGDLFGLAEISAGGRRSASAETMTPSVIWTIPNRRLATITTRLPRLALRVIQVLSLRLRAVTLQMQAIVTLPVRLRVANFLLAHAEPAPQGTAVTGQWTHEAIADMLGCTRQTVTEVLNELARSSLVRVARKRIVVVDPWGLERLLEDALGRSRPSVG